MEITAVDSNVVKNFLAKVGKFADDQEEGDKEDGPDHALGQFDRLGFLGSDRHGRGAAGFRVDANGNAVVHYG